MSKEEIIYRNVDELIPYERNPRKNDGAVEYVANSIREFGFKVPIVVDENDVIIAGHTRLKASKELDMDVVPTIVASDLTDEQVRAFRLADNKTGEIAEWEFDELASELDNMGIDMEQFGFDESLPDLDIDDVFQDYYENESEEEEEETEVLKWADKKVELTEDDVEYLNDKYHEYTSMEPEDSFIGWLSGRV